MFEHFFNSNKLLVFFLNKKNQLINCVFFSHFLLAPKKSSYRQQTDNNKLFCLFKPEIRKDESF